MNGFGGKLIYEKEGAGRVDPRVVAGPGGGGAGGGFLTVTLSAVLTGRSVQALLTS